MTRPYTTSALCALIVVTIVVLDFTNECSHHASVEGGEHIITEIGRARDSASQLKIAHRFAKSHRSEELIALWLEHRADDVGVDALIIAGAMQTYSTEYNQHLEWIGEKDRPWSYLSRGVRRMLERHQAHKGNAKGSLLID